jgi:hypothetical protein
LKDEKALLIVDREKESTFADAKTNDELSKSIKNKSKEKKSNLTEFWAQIIGVKKRWDKMRDKKKKKKKKKSG